ncbi:ATP-binding protein [Candidatus Woesearchaeota archaeon]|nr:ATP-binding protein [Candidatus Woesearchaeota archaeon]
MRKRILKNITFLIVGLILLNVSVLGFASPKNIFPRTNLEFYILESDFAEGKYLDGNCKDYGFIKYNNKETPFNRPIDNRMLTLRSQFRIDRQYENQELYLVSPPLDYPCSIYINGKLLSLRGDIKHKYTNRLHETESYLISPDRIKFDSINEIAFQLYPLEGESYPFGSAFISNTEDAKSYVFLRNLLGTKLIYGLSLISIVFFVFFLIIYLSQKDYLKQQYLFFALMNLFFALSYINNLFTYNFSNTYFLEKLARASFPLSIFVGICFLLEYTLVFKKKKLIKTIMLPVYIVAVLLVLTPGTTTETIKAWNGYPLVVIFLGNIFLFTISVVYFYKERNTKSWFFIIIIFLNLIAGFYDGYYFAVLKLKPFVLLTPISVFGINLTTFFILAVDHSILYNLTIKNKKKLENMNQELELIVEQRTKKTQEYANKLEEANKTKDKFFSIIAHDMKNPFNTLIGYSDLLKTDFREYGQDEIYQQLNIIHKTSVKGYNLLENLLQWSQTQTDKIVFEPIKIDLYKIVASCISDIENLSQFKDIDINNDIKEDFHIIADENLLKTVIRNLISNAIKYTTRNGMVTIHAEKNNLETIVSVKDTGIGMSENEIENLFQIDKIYSKPGTNKEKGSGLGLILCKEFVEKHEGKIWVESELEIGSVFSFCIPKILQVS